MTQTQMSCARKKKISGLLFSACTYFVMVHGFNLPSFYFLKRALIIADIVTPEEQEQVFAASVHNLSKMAAILLQECVTK